MPTGGCPKQPASRSRTTSMKRPGGQTSCLGQNTTQKPSPDCTTKASALFSYLMRRALLQIVYGRLPKVLSLTRTQRSSGLLSEIQLKTLADLESALENSSIAGKHSRSTHATLTE